MRELKFRIWDKEYKRFRDYDEIFIDQEGEVYEMEERSWAYQSYMHKENITEKVEVMQYTGLKDKNGKEIYEGDIVEGKAYEFNKCPQIIGKVIYDYCEFKVKVRKDNSTMKTELNTIYEVIGNVFDMPDWDF